MTTEIQQTLAEHLAFREGQYEEKVIKRLLEHYNLPSKVKYQLLNMYEEKYQEKRLTLTFFHIMFPTFPVFLDANRVHKQVRRLSLPDLCKRFEQLPIWDAYQEAWDRYSGCEERKPVGVVFPWAYLRDEVIVHDLLVDQPNPGFRMQYKTKDGVVLTLQSFSDFIADIDRREGGKWAP